MRVVFVGDLAQKRYQSRGEFLQEVGILRRLRHPNVATLLSADQEQLTLTLPRAPCDLRFLLDQDSKGPLISIDRQIQSALDHIHDLGIVHGDIKEENILYDPQENRVWVSDFHLSTPTDQVDEFSVLNTVTHRPRALFCRRRVQPLDIDKYAHLCVLLNLTTGRLWNECTEHHTHTPTEGFCLGSTHKAWEAWTPETLTPPTIEGQLKRYLQARLLETNPCL